MDSYLRQGELVLLVLVLTFVGIWWYARRASKKKNGK